MHARQLVPGLLAAVGFLPVYTSCAGSVDFWDQRDVTINPPEGVYSASGEQTVDLSSDSAIASQLNKIQSVQVAEVWLQVTNVDSANVAKFASGSLQVAAPDADPTQDSSWVTLGNYQDLQISPDAKIEVIPTADQQAVIDQVQKWSEAAPYKFQVKYQGEFCGDVPSGAHCDQAHTLTSGTVNFTIESRIHLIANVSL